ncbi:MAG TPA: MBL fold metallo-hydrolase [Candidatus Saccharimonadales bacterium]
MKLTKYTHACLLLQKGITKLLIDPGVFTHDLTDLADIHAVIITHEHPDHFDIEKLKQILTDSPQAMIYTNASVADKAVDLGSAVHIIEANDELTVGDFQLKFVGGKHAQIFKTIDPIENIGVIIDDLLFVPGDSYFIPEAKPAWLALPLNAPWAKLDETLTFANTMQPKHVFAVHDGLLSEAGHQVYGGGRGLSENMQWHNVRPGDSIQL